MISKSHTVRGALATLLAAAFAADVVAQEAPPPIPIELRARFGFTGPLVRKVADGFYGLQVHDVDGDGKNELTAFDSRRARIVVVRVADGATTMDSIPTGGQINGYEFADVDGNGRDDLLLVDSRGRLVVRRNGSEEGSRPFDLGLGSRGMRVYPGDLDGDGKAELVLISRDKMRVADDVDGMVDLSPVEPVDDSIHSVHVVDVDGDGRLDLVGIVPGERMNLRLRLGVGDGTFGAWRITTVDSLRDVFPTRLADGSFGLATIEGANRRVAMHRFGDHGAEAALEWWAFGATDATQTPPFTTGDIDNDGDEDLVLFPKGSAQMVVYRWQDGAFTRSTVPTLAGVACAAIGDVDQDGKNDLVITSPEELAVAWCSGAAPLDRFPQQLPVVETPVAATVAPDGGVLVISRDKRRRAKLHRTTPEGEPQELVDLGRMQADPARLLAADVGDGEGLEAAFVVPGDGLRVVALQGAGKQDEESSAGFTRKMDDGALQLAVADGGKAALLAVRERFVRTFRFDGDRQVVVLAQDNGPDGAEELTLACEFGDGQRLYFDKKGSKLLRTTPGQPTQQVEVPALGFTHLVAHEGSALLISAQGMLRVPFATGPSLKSVTTCEPPTERTYFWHGMSGDFDGDGVTDLVVIDRRLPGVQILAGGEQGLQRALAVPVFETRPSESPDSEPRDLATGDLDGDGRCDFALIAHDRILIYPQDK